MRWPRETLRQAAILAPGTNLQLASLATGMLQSLAPEAVGLRVDIGELTAKMQARIAEGRLVFLSCDLPQSETGRVIRQSHAEAWRQNPAGSALWPTVIRLKS